jgi:hypothetical protein
VVHFYNPGNVGGGDRRTMAKVSMGKKLVVSYLKKTSQVWWFVPVTPAIWEAEIGGLWSEAGSRGKNLRLYLKN